jgi:hypothetical protein
MIEEESMLFIIYGCTNSKLKLMNIWLQEIEIIKLYYSKCKANDKVTISGIKTCFRLHLINWSTFKYYLEPIFNPTLHNI